MGRAKGDVVTAIVDYSLKNGVYVNVGGKNHSILIKKNQLAKDIENARPSRFVKGDKLDAMITEIDRDKKTVTLSIKALEEKQTKEAVKKYGSTDSGALLGDILRPLLKKKLWWGRVEHNNFQNAFRIPLGGSARVKWSRTSVDGIILGYTRHTKFLKYGNIYDKTIR